MICTLGAMRYASLDPNDHTLRVWKIDSEGNPKGEPVHQEESDGEGFELWRCNNCGRQKQAFVELQKHLGKFNGLIDPFNWPEKETPP